MGTRLEKNAELVRKRIKSHTFDSEEGDEYEESKFGGFNDYFRRKKLKLQNLDDEIRSSAAGNSQIFHGIVAHVNGYTQPSLNDIHKLVVSHGGGFMQYLDGKTTVTHIIASTLTPKKAVEFRQYRIAKPAWVVDSITAGKLLPWNAYKVIDEGIGQRLLAFDQGKAVSQATTQKTGYRDQTNTSWYTRQVQNFADDIDDEYGARFPSSQILATNRMGDYFDQPRSQAKVESYDPILSGQSEKDKLLSSSAGFDVTSSLEAALNYVADNRPSPSQSAVQGQTHLPENGVKPVEELSEATSIPTSPAVSAAVEDYTAMGELDRSAEDDNILRSKKLKSMTAEEHNAILLADPYIRKISTANPNFLKQYYSESRLHHLSTWKADLKSRFQKMASEKSSSQKSVKRKFGSRRYVMHVDFDSFFCAVSLKNAPEFVSKPAVVAHGHGTASEIASCNYPARKFGVRNGMWMKQALTLCADIKVLPYDFPAYEEASRNFYEAIINVGGIVQSVSIDEALVDISMLCLAARGSDGAGISEESLRCEQEKADEIATKLRGVIEEKTGCAVSVGIGGNILQAKVALRKAKPAGQYQIKPEEVLDFMGELTVTDLPSVAYSIGGKLEGLGIKFIKDLRQLTKERLSTVLGPKTGERLWEYARGIDKTEVGEQVVRKSVAAEVNWGIRFISQYEAEEFVRNLCFELQRRLVDQKVKGRHLTMKIMNKSADAPLDPPKSLGHGKCDTYNKSVVLGVATNSAEVTGREAVSILRSYGFSPGELRGLGIQMTKLEPIKSGSEGSVDGSQRKINFDKAFANTAGFEHDSIDDPLTPKKIAKHSSPITRDTLQYYPIENITPQKAKFVPGRLMDLDPIDEINSPQKSKSTPVHPAAAISRANAADKSAKKFLNLTGTQFILPTQVDPTVLAELPPDIKSRLQAQRRCRPISELMTPLSKSSVTATIQQCRNTPLPTQFDPEVFDALPDDMKAELLDAQRRRQTETRSGTEPPILASYRAPAPLTPKKPKPAARPAPTKRWTPTKKRGRLSGSRNKREDPYVVLTQSNMMASKRDNFTGLTKCHDDELPDEDFLAALPEDVRLEVLAEYKQRQSVKKGGLSAALLNRKRRPPPELAQTGPRRLRLPARSPKPTFTTMELNTAKQLRETTGVWYHEFADEGPNWEDVGAMERYLRRVIVDEKNMGKVVAIIKWLEWLVDDGADDDHKGTKIWLDALTSMKEKVQLAVEDRGLGKLSL
ncbi:hypothetical protein BJ878DRAFT_421380 [Calycina marina]|uniref:DNA repair protein REV1 n=1 Tax=Calycina marina TaxID=1763456 RepID=A0A9P7Z358_9HELO|nr:hypothetical protein BJ878DRAFT_421380 [Calycina marina]